MKRALAMLKMKILIVVALAVTTIPASAQTNTTFTYQGDLMDSGAPADGTFNLDFSLWDALGVGTQIGSTINLVGVPVTGGKFAVELDFGASAFDNSGRWLEVAVMGIPLMPRHPITRSPYSIQTRGIVVDADENVGIGTAVPQFALHVVSDDTAVLGHTTETVTAATGVYGQSDSPIGYGVFGLGAAGSGNNFGVYGRTNSVNGTGVYGRAALGGSGAATGVVGQAQSNNGIGVYGWASASSGDTTAIWGYCQSPTGDAGRFNGRGYFSGYVGFGQLNPVYPVHARRSNGIAIYGEGLWGVQGTSIQPDGRGVFGYDTRLDGENYGVYGLSGSVDGTGVYGYTTNGTGLTYGVHGQSESSTGRGVFGLATSASGSTYGVYGNSQSDSGIGVFGYAPSTTGLTNGVYGEVASGEGVAVSGVNTAASGPGDGIGVYGQSDWGVAIKGVGAHIGILGDGGNNDFFAAGPGTDYGSASSIRWKTNIVPIGEPLEKLARLRGVYYTWDEEHGGQHDLGMIAEEVGAVLPEIVSFEANGVDAIGMDYSKLTPLLVEAVNAQQAQIENLKTQLASMQAMIDQLLARQSADTSRATVDTQGANP
jgi:hypothetical protein